MENYKDLLEQLKIWKHQTLTFLRTFAAAFVTQMIATGLDSSTEFQTYMNAALVALGGIIVTYLNPKDKRFGFGTTPPPPPNPGGE